MKPKFKKVSSLQELYRLAAHDERYRDLLISSAENLGSKSNPTVKEAEAWLNVSAAETTTEDFDGEQGVLDEVNGLI